MKIQSAVHLSAILAVAASALTACGSGDAPAPAPQQPAPVAQAPKPADPTAKMARAVVSGKSGAAVELKYDVLSKPEPGKPIEIDLALISGSVADSLTVNVTAAPGLEVLSNATGNFGTLKFGEVAHHKVTVRADRADVVYLTVTAIVNAVGVNSARTFAIPLIFTEPGATGTPTAAVHATNDAQTKPDATGQKIQSMPAQESK
jgi:hypothetical protein